jgi:hypothetical protein
MTMVFWAQMYSILFPGGGPDGRYAFRYPWFRPAPWDLQKLKIEMEHVTIFRIEIDALGNGQLIAVRDSGDTKALSPAFVPNRCPPPGFRLPSGQLNKPKVVWIEFIRASEADGHR